MKITIDTTDVLEGLEFRVITPDGCRNPVTSTTFLLFGLVRILRDTILMVFVLIPATLYLLFVVEYWPVLKAEGLTLWQAGAGLAALYGLFLHWWRTTLQSKLYQLDMKKTHHSLLGLSNHESKE